MGGSTSAGIPGSSWNGMGGSAYPGIYTNKYPVTECSKTHDFPTFVYGHQLDTHELKHLTDIYRI